MLTDNIRTSDKDNPRGYYELEPVKNTKSDPSWVPNAVGKAVKMVYRLLYNLPKDYEYRVIFMRRNVDEVLASQKIMLERIGQKGANANEEKLADLFKRDLEKVYRWVDSQDNFSMVSINYKDMVKSALPQCRRANEFLGGDLDIDKMASVVNPSLYRNR